MLYRKWTLAIMFGFAATVAAAEPPPMHAYDEFAREDQHAPMEAEREYWKHVQEREREEATYHQEQAREAQKTAEEREREYWKRRAERKREYLKHQTEAEREYWKHVEEIERERQKAQPPSGNASIGSTGGSSNAKPAKSSVRDAGRCLGLRAPARILFVQKNVSGVTRRREAPAGTRHQAHTHA